MHRGVLLLFFPVLAAIACRRKSDAIEALPSVPLGLPARVFPANDPPTPAKVTLGRALFFDRRLSKSETTSCADCHRPDHGWSADTPGSVNAAGRITSRKSPTVLNAGRRAVLTWDGRANSVEQIVRIAWTAQLSADPSAIATRLESNDDYRAMFRAAFAAPASEDTILRALGAYLRVLDSGDAPYDRFVAGDATALSASAKRGKERFEALGCGGCHRGPLFTDDAFHAVIGGSDPGRENATHDAKDHGKFRTPSLRDVARTGPWFHDGSATTLEDAIRRMIAGGSGDPLLVPHVATDADVAAIREFLESLSGTTSLPPPTHVLGKDVNSH